jgi:hypothetical protein
VLGQRADEAFERRLNEVVVVMVWPVKDTLQTSSDAGVDVLIERLRRPALAGNNRSEQLARLNGVLPGRRASLDERGGNDVSTPKVASRGRFQAKKSGGLGSGSILRVTARLAPQPTAQLGPMAPCPPRYSALRR